MDSVGTPSVSRSAVREAVIAVMAEQREAVNLRQAGHATKTKTTQTQPQTQTKSHGVRTVRAASGRRSSRGR